MHERTEKQGAPKAGASARDANEKADGRRLRRSEIRKFIERHRETFDRLAR